MVANAKVVTKQKTSTKLQEPSDATKRWGLTKRSSEAGFSEPSNEKGDEIDERLSPLDCISIRGATGRISIRLAIPTW